MNTLSDLDTDPPNIWYLKTRLKLGIEIKTEYFIPSNQRCSSSDQSERIARLDLVDIIVEK